MTPYLIAATITAACAYSLFGPLIERSSRRVAIGIPLLAATLGAYLYHPGTWHLIIPIVIVALLDRLFARHRHQVDPSGESNTGRSPAVPLTLLASGFLLSLNFQAYSSPIAAIAPFLLMGAGTLWLLANPIVDTIRTPQPMQHMLTHNSGVAAYVLTVLTICFFLGMFFNPSLDNITRFLITGAATIFMHVYRIQQRNKREAAAERARRDQGSEYAPGRA